MAPSSNPPLPRDPGGPVRQAPSDRAAAPVESAAARLDEQRRRLRSDISAYPGSMTYLDLIRRNKRQSVILLAAMLLLGLVVGALMGAAIGGYIGASSRPMEGYITESTRFDLTALLPAALAGGVIALILSSAGATWSWFAGDSAILRMSGARQITKQMDPELFNVVDELRIAAGLPMPRVYLIEETAMNAFATGRDPEHAAIAITTALRERLSRDELQGVMAHEMAHVRHYDIRFALLMATMVGLIVFACDAFWRIGFRGALYGGGRRSSGRRGGGQGIALVIMLVVALVLAIVAPIFARIIQMAYSRQREYLADAGGVQLTRNPEGLASALQRLGDDKEPLVEAANRGTAHMFIVNPLRKMRSSGQTMDSMFSSHPPIQKRIARLLALTR